MCALLLLHGEKGTRGNILEQNSSYQIDRRSQVSLHPPTIIRPHDILRLKSRLPEEAFFQSKFCTALFPGKHKIIDRTGAGFVNSYVKQQPPRIFNHILDAAEEENGFSAINQPVVICQSEVHHRPCKDVAIHNHRSLYNRMHPKNC
jgi:hypothetical protein